MSEGDVEAMVPMVELVLNLRSMHLDGGHAAAASRRKYEGLRWKNDRRMWRKLGQMASVPPAPRIRERGVLPESCLACIRGGH